MLKPTLLVVTLAAAPFAAQAELKLTSPSLTEGGTLPTAQVANVFGCTGENLSPALDWTGAPEGTKSFVLTAYDPDAPTGSGWWHWTVYDIPASATGLPEGASGKAMPAGSVEGATDAGAPGFLGACPPPGAPHHYIFTLYALPVDKLGLDPKASPAMLGFMTIGQALEKATLTVTYGQ